MPDRGLLERPLNVATPPGEGPPPPWHIASARWAQITFEVSKAAALGAMPGEVSRPVPCYARLFVLDALDSPAGPLRLAALLVGGRYQLMPKNLLVEAIVDGPAGAVAAVFGGGFRPGSVAFDREGSAVRATVSAGAESLALLTLPALRAVAPTMLRWDPWLGFARHNGAIDIIEYGPRPEAREAFLSKGATLETPPELPRSHTWRQFRNLNTISGCYVEGVLTLTAPVVQQTLE